MPDSTLPGCRREAQVAGRGLEKGPGAGGWWLLQPGRWDLSPHPSLLAGAGRRSVSRVPYPTLLLLELQGS